jgi:hypothetical protein
MQIFVVYAQLKNKLKILGVHTGQYYLEARYDFFPRRRNTPLTSYQEYVTNSLFIDAKTLTTEVESNLDEESFVDMFSKKIKASIVEFGDEKVLMALSAK